MGGTLKRYNSRILGLRSDNQLMHFSFRVLVWPKVTLAVNITKLLHLLSGSQMTSYVISLATAADADSWRSFRSLFDERAGQRLSHTIGKENKPPQHHSILIMCLSE